MRNMILTVAGALAIAACFDRGETSNSSGYEQAKETAAVLTGDAKSEAADNPVCNLFKPKELEAYIGEPVGEPQNAAGGSGCQWLAKDDEGDVLIQIVGRDYHEPHTGVEGHRKLSGPGEEAFVERLYDGWSAGAIVGEHSVIAMVAGDKASAETAEALLRETAKRRAKGRP